MDTSRKSFESFFTENREKFLKAFILQAQKHQSSKKLQKCTSHCIWVQVTPNIFLFMSCRSSQQTKARKSRKLNLYSLYNDTARKTLTRPSSSWTRLIISASPSSLQFIHPSTSLTSIPFLSYLLYNVFNPFSLILVCDDKNFKKKFIKKRNAVPKLFLCVPMNSKDVCTEKHDEINLTDGCRVNCLGIESGQGIELKLSMGSDSSSMEAAWKHSAASLIRPSCLWSNPK